MQVIIRLPQVIKRIALSRSTIYQLIKKNQFPAAISLGSRSVGWLSSDIDQFIERRIAISRNKKQVEEGQNG